jgi:hypothetical protein
MHNLWNRCWILPSYIPFHQARAWYASCLRDDLEVERGPR